MKYNLLRKIIFEKCCSMSDSVDVAPWGFIEYSAIHGCRHSDAEYYLSYRRHCLVCGLFKEVDKRILPWADIVTGVTYSMMACVRCAAKRFHSYEWVDQSLCCPLKQPLRSSSLGAS